MALGPPPLCTFARASILGAPTPCAASMWTPPRFASPSAARRNHEPRRFLGSSAATAWTVVCVHRDQRERT